MLKIEIVAAQAHERTVTPASGKPAFLAREQDGYAYVFDRNGTQEKHPAKIVINLERDQKPHEPGFYTLLPESLYIGRYGQIEVGRLKLKPITATVAAAVPKAA